MIAHVTISPKRVVLDPQGKVVQSGLHKLGYEQIGEVRVGKFITLDLGELGDLDRAGIEAMVDRMCRQFLANPIIEDYHFELVEG